ncbi:pentapeptide repeat-containing protein, partial [Salinibacter ruber]|uniref:pentapeptide repeat-containing protein n=1 Tax=Salinibacter ruber TaxID=146919 RepID=UPI00355B2C38
MPNVSPNLSRTDLSRTDLSRTDLSSTDLSRPDRPSDHESARIHCRSAFDYRRSR